MRPVLAFPDLEGMSYPELDRRLLRVIVPGPEAIISLPGTERARIRVLMTSASRGCGSSIVEALPNLELVVSQGAGVEKIDRGILADRGVKLRAVGEAVTDDVADLALAMSLMLLRRIPQADSFARSGGWAKGRFAVTESAVGKVIGIVGLSGRIGQAIARRAQASRMETAGLERSSNHGLGARLYPTLAALAEASDILVLALPGAPELTHLIDAAVLEQLGPEGILINVARGNLVDTNALIEALERRGLGGAGLDVLEAEPEVPNRLAALPNVVLTPHIGAQTWGQRARASAIAEHEILSFLGME